MDPALTGPLDDAAIALPEGYLKGLVYTIDVITPIVDDPRVFGAIAAANAISDVYAMGGTPQIALSFVGFPTDKLPLSMLGEVMVGMQACAAKAGCAIVGGHTIADGEPKAGLAVIGNIDRNRIWSHKNARAGDVLLLSKAIGTGIVGQSVRAGRADDDLIGRAAAQMMQLNQSAMEAGLEAGAHACTDVTGFGLLGHLKHIVEASGLCATLNASDVPLIEGVLELAFSGLVPGGSKRNLQYASAISQFDSDVEDTLRLLLADAQTSGGLLLCVPPERAHQCLEQLQKNGCENAAIVGSLAQADAAPQIKVIR